jgi:hypothetical protein
MFPLTFELAAVWTLAGGLSLSIMLVASQRTSPSGALPDADVERLLASTDPREQAWGAWIAGTEDRVEMIPALQDILRRTPEPATRFEEAARDAALDALVQLPSEPPAALLVPGTGTRGAPVAWRVCCWIGSCSPSELPSGVRERNLGSVSHVMADFILGVVLMM